MLERNRLRGDAARRPDDEEDQERLANIEELLTVAREFDERHPGDGRATWRRFWKRRAW